jgi:hypothetical protein
MVGLGDRAIGRLGDWALASYDSIHEISWAVALISLIKISKSELGTAFLDT